LFDWILMAATLLYGMACWNALRYYRTLEPASDGSAVRGLGAAFVLHSFLLGGRWFLEGQGPLVSLDGVLLSLAFSLTVALLVGRLVSPVPVLTSLFSPFILLLVLLALSAGSGEPSAAAPSMNGALIVHILLTFLGFAHFTLGFGVGVAFWVQEGQLKNHRVGAFGYRLPALETLDGLTSFYTGLGLLFWAGGLLLGAREAILVWDRLPVSDPKILGSFLVLLIYTFFFILRWGFRMRGRKTMGLVLIGYFLALFTFVGVRVFLTTQHSF